MNRSGQLAFYLAVIAFLVSCAGAKIKDERVSLKAGAISKKDTILVKTISADGATFTGDKANDAQRVSEEKKLIKQLLADEIVVQLKKRGFTARHWDGKESGTLVDGTVTLFEHGSGAARMFVGMGAGSSNLHMNMKVSKGRETLADFTVIATSGGRGGLSSLSSFLQAHITDGAEKTAEYIAKQAN